MTNSMLRYVLILALGLASAGLAAAQNQGEVVDAILATVGDEVILMSEVRAEIAPALFELRQEDLSAGEYEQRRDELLEEALDQAVENLILVQEARRRGMEVPDHAIEDRLEKLRGRYPSQEAFREDIEQAGETLSDIRARLRRQVLAVNMSMLQREQFEQAVVVSEDEAVQYYQDNRERFRRPGRVRVRQIFLPADGEDSMAEAREQAEALLAEVEEGEAFGDLAREYSEAPGAAEGGLVGWQQRGDLIEPLNSEAFELGEGQVSDVLETDFGAHILKVDEREDEGHAAFEEVRSEIINHLRQEKADARYDRWMADQRRRAGVQRFAEGLL
ncbi:MAG: peptidylprolyl isomerase [Candidatus Hydrogenedentota bacterium]